MLAIITTPRAAQSGAAGGGAAGAAATWGQVQQHLFSDIRDAWTGL